jgi:hypothetical protein
MFATDRSTASTIITITSITPAAHSESLRRSLRHSLRLLLRRFFFRALEPPQRPEAAAPNQKAVPHPRLGTHICDALDHRVVPVRGCNVERRSPLRRNAPWT